MLADGFCSVLYLGLVGFQYLLSRHWYPVKARALLILLNHSTAIEDPDMKENQTNLTRNFKKKTYKRKKTRRVPAYLLTGNIYATASVHPAFSFRSEATAGQARVDESHG